MIKYIFKRIFLIFLTLFITLSVAFVIVRLMPDNPIDDPSIPPEAIEKLKSRYGYDKPIGEQYVIWVKGVVTEWDWGDSLKLRPNTPVFDYVSEKIPISMRLNIYALLLSIPIGIILGMIAALKKNSLTDHSISIGVIFFISVPSFVTASLLRYYIGFKWGILPGVFDDRIPDVLNEAMIFSSNYYNVSTGNLITTEGLDSVTGLPVDPDNMVNGIHMYWDMFKSMIMPILALSFGTIAGLARYTRAELTEVLTSDFMLLAKTKGLTRTQATIRHAFRNSLVPLVGMIIGSFIGILGGSLIIEQIFSINGVGGVSLESLNAKDYPITLAIMAFYSSISLFTVLFVDLMYGVVDPRIRLGGIK